MKKMSSPSESKEALETLVRVSREYGENPDYVLAGGGNTSCKDDSRMFVKASGTQLGTIEADGFTEIDLEKLNKIWESEYSADKDQREEEVLKDLMASRVDPEGRRPSVETLLHGLFPFTYVIHTHPALINGITCSREGEEAARKVFGEDIIWIPVIDPGYILALAVKEKVDAYLKETGEFPQVVALQNHGIFIASDSIDEIAGKYKSFMDKVSMMTGLTDPAPFARDEDLTREAAALLSGKDDVAVVGYKSDELSAYLADENSFGPLSQSPTPDHIVYSGYRPLWLDCEKDLPAATEDFEKKEGFFPRIIAVKGRGIVACHESTGKAETAASLFLDHMKIARTADFFGGLQFMPAENVDFIRNWEVEKYRASQAK